MKEVHRVYNYIYYFIFIYSRVTQKFNYYIALMVGVWTNGMQGLKEYAHLLLNKATRRWQLLQIVSISRWNGTV